MELGPSISHVVIDQELPDGCPLLSLAPGTTVLVIGSFGAGKSTLVNAFAGAVPIEGAGPGLDARTDDPHAAPLPPPLVDFAETSDAPTACTQTYNVYHFSRYDLRLVDTPGYSDVADDNAARTLHVISLLNGVYVDAAAAKPPGAGRSKRRRRRRKVRIDVSAVWLCYPATEVRVLSSVQTLAEVVRAKGIPLVVVGLRALYNRAVFVDNALSVGLADDEDMVIPVVARPFYADEDDDNDFRRAGGRMLLSDVYQLDALAELTARVAVVKAGSRSPVGSDDPARLCASILALAVPAAGAAGAIPVPVLDFVPLASVQAAMLSGMLAAYGRDSSLQTTMMLLGGALTSAAGIGLVAEQICASLLDLVPGLVLIDAALAASFTATLGLAAMVALARAEEEGLDADLGLLLRHSFSAVAAADVLELYEAVRETGDEALESLRARLAGGGAPSDGGGGGGDDDDDGSGGGVDGVLVVPSVGGEEAAEAAGGPGEDWVATLLRLSTLGYVDPRTTVTGARWVPNSEVTECWGCAAAFGPLLRIHHCRFCGRTFCHACSGRALAWGGAAHRACDGCWAARNVLPSAPPTTDSDAGGSSQSGDSNDDDA